MTTTLKQLRNKLDKMQAKFEEMTHDISLWKVYEGYYDPTVGKAIVNVSKKPIEVDLIIDRMKKFCSMYGYTIHGEIALKHKATGMIFK